MRRSVLALAGTVLGITLMVGAKLAHPDPATDVVADTAAPDGATDAQAQTSGPPSAAAPGASASAGTRTPAPKTTSTATPRPGSTARPAPSAPAPTTAKPAPKFKDGTFSGPAVSEKYGSITVTVVISGGVITQASGTCACSGDSQTISQRAFTGTSSRKGLNRSTLDSQSASIATYSGATYTSTAYKQSLASALTKAKP